MVRDTVPATGGVYDTPHQARLAHSVLAHFLLTFFAGTPLDMMTSLFRLMINARNEGTEKDTILIKGGSVTFVGGLNTGSGSIIIETQQPVKIVDLINGDDANVVFNQTKDVLLAGVENRGKIILFDSIISIADTTNAGTIDVSGGMYAWYGGSNAGTIKASVSSALLDIDENSGRIVVEAGVINITVGKNTGEIVANTGDVEGTIFIADRTACGKVVATPAVTVQCGPITTVTMTSTTTATATTTTIKATSKQLLICFLFCFGLCFFFFFSVSWFHQMT